LRQWDECGRQARERDEHTCVDWHAAMPRRSITRRCPHHAATEPRCVRPAEILPLSSHMARYWGPRDPQTPHQPTPARHAGADPVVLHEAARRSRRQRGHWMRPRVEADLSYMRKPDRVPAPPPSDPTALGSIRRTGRPHTAPPRRRRASPSLPSCLFWSTDVRYPTTSNVISRHTARGRDITLESGVEQHIARPEPWCCPPGRTTTSRVVSLGIRAHHYQSTLVRSNALPGPMRTGATARTRRSGNTRTGS
jgi:hypothetical protein